MESLGKLISTLKKASIDFQFYPVHRKKSLAYIMHSSKLNQVIIVKIPGREHYISKALAHQYLQSSRKMLEDILPSPVCKNAYVLNILISSKLTASRFELITTDRAKKNMDMLFNSKKTTDNEILGAIFKALSTKCQSWITHIKRGCKNKNINPFNEVKNKIKDIEKAADIFHFESIRLKGRGS